jgi:hypothetical protein
VFWCLDGLPPGTKSPNSQRHWITGQTHLNLFESTQTNRNIGFVGLKWQSTLPAFGRLEGGVLNMITLNNIFTPY